MYFILLETIRNIINVKGIGRVDKLKIYLKVMNTSINLYIGLLMPNGGYEGQKLFEEDTIIVRQIRRNYVLPSTKSEPLQLTILKS